VTQEEDLDILGGGAAGEQSEPAEQPEYDQIQQLEHPIGDHVVIAFGRRSRSSSHL